jgi:hypothetical protein
LFSTLRNAKPERDIPAVAGRGGVDMGWIIGIVIAFVLIIVFLAAIGAMAGSKAQAYYIEREGREWPDE